MDCAVEESDIRRALEPIAGIHSLNFQLAARTLRIQAPQEQLTAAVAAVRKAGYEIEPIDSAAKAGTGGHADHDHGVAESPWRLGLALALAIAAETVEFAGLDGTPWKSVIFGVAVVAIYLSGVDVYKKGINAVLHLKLNINALMSVAVTGALAIGQWPEAAMVMALYSIAELIEAKAADRARNAIKGLLALSATEADQLQSDGTWKTVPAAEVAKDAVLRIKPGERVPLDGVVTKGNSAINQAPVTGESIPMDKAPGDTVFAGTINETAELEFRVTAVSADTTLARIIHAVEEAQGTRAPTQRFVDKFASYYTPAVFFVALAVALLAPFLMQLTWLEALYKALVLLVVACPCALVISTPVTVVSGLAAAARRGILIKGGTYLEEARNLKAVALDKTGTVTQGKPKLVDWRTWGDGDEATIKQVAASLASRSDHPVSQAILAGVKTDALAVESFEAIAGKGVSGTVDGKALTLANHRLIHERGLCSAELEAELKQHESQGRTVTLLAGESGVLALFAVADTIRESSRQAIADLKALGVTPVMLTGDNTATAKSIAQQAGIEDARGELLPEAKLEAIKEMQKRYGPTGMAGFAMGGAGTDTAMETADVVIMNDNLQRVAETIRLSRRTHAVLWQNITLALGIKSVFFVMAVFGNATMWMAVFADMGATLLVVANGLRLMRGVTVAEPVARDVKAKESHAAHAH
jgi:Cd2+/Zn2+-exporting ATPase